RRPFAAGIGTTGETRGFPLAVVVDAQAVGVAQPLGLDVVPQGGELLADRFGDGFVHGGDIGFDETEPGGGDGLLDVHLEVDHVHYQLRHGLHDSVAAGRTDGDPRLVFAQDEHGAEAGELAPAGEGVERIAFGLESAVGHRVVEPDAGGGDHDLAAEEIAERLRRGDDVALAIGNDEVGRVFFRPRAAGRLQWQRLARVDLGRLG